MNLFNRLHPYSCGHKHLERVTVSITVQPFDSWNPILDWRLTCGACLRRAIETTSAVVILDRYGYPEIREREVPHRESEARFPGTITLRLRFEGPLEPESACTIVAQIFAPPDA